MPIFCALFPILCCGRKLEEYKNTQPLIGMPEPLPETDVLADHGPPSKSSDQSEASKRRQKPPPPPLHNTIIIYRMTGVWYNIIYIAQKIDLELLQMFFLILTLREVGFIQWYAHQHFLQNHRLGRLPICSTLFLYCTLVGLGLHHKR